MMLYLCYNFISFSISKTMTHDKCCGKCKKIEKWKKRHRKAFKKLEPILWILLICFSGMVVLRIKNQRNFGPSLDLTREEWVEVKEKIMASRTLMVLRSKAVFEKQWGLLGVKKTLMCQIKR